MRRLALFLAIVSTPPRAQAAPVPTDRALIEDLIESSTILAAKSSRTPTITGAPWIAGIAPNSSA